MIGALRKIDQKTCLNVSDLLESTLTSLVKARENFFVSQNSDAKLPVNSEKIYPMPSFLHPFKARVIV